MIITLTTDFGLKDHYVGALKGMLYSEKRDIQIVDISHLVSPFVLEETAYVVGAAFNHFPEKTIHLILADAEISEHKKPLVIQWKNHYFISADNGILSLLTAEQEPDVIVALPYTNELDATSIFVKAAAALANGVPILDLGEQIHSLKEVLPLKPTVSEDNTRITGNIIYIDHYGNAISNISRELFEKIQNGRNFEISFRSYRITKIQNSYIEFSKEKYGEIGEKLALFNNSGLLEIAIYRGSRLSGGTASSLLGIEYQSSISVKFL